MQVYVHDYNRCNYKPKMHNISGFKTENIPLNEMCVCVYMHALYDFYDFCDNMDYISLYCESLS